MAVVRRAELSASELVSGQNLAAAARCQSLEVPLLGVHHEVFCTTAMYVCNVTPDSMSTAEASGARFGNVTCRSAFSRFTRSLASL